MNLYSKYFDEYVKLYPSMNDGLQLKKYQYLRTEFENSISPEYKEKTRLFLEKYKNLLKKKKKLSIYDKVLKYDIETGLESLKYPTELLPIDQMNNTISYYIQMLNGSTFYQFNTEKDFTDFMIKNKNFSTWCCQAITNFNKGIKEGIVLPKKIAEMTIHDIENMIKNKDYINPKVPKKLKEKWNENVENFVLAPINNIVVYMKNIYLPKCRKSLGHSSMKNGKQMYKFIVRNQTTDSSMTIKKIHNLGWSEIKRIKAEMVDIMKKMRFSGTFKEFTKYVQNLRENKYSSKKEILADYKRIRTYLWNELIPQNFEITIKKPYTIKEIPASIAESSAGAYYIGGSIDGKRNGVFYLNTRDTKHMLKSDSLVLSKHEGLPGHHFQITYMNEKKSIPNFIKAEAYNGYVEGWALYAENLGEYTDLEYFGKLNSEMLRAVRLVVDTGLHYYNWSYQRSFDLFKKYTTFPKSEIDAEIYRYVADPGQALSYKLGELTILDLRKKYLSKHNNIKKFHTLVLENGSLPLDILREKILDHI